MKKIILLFCVLASFGLTNRLHAQAQVALGIKAGLNLAKIDGSSISVDSRAGYHGGAFVLFKLSKIGIQPEIVFSSQGFKTKSPLSLPFGLGDLKSTYNYVNIPIIVKIYLAAGLNLQLGPQFGFVTKAESEIFDTSSIVTTADVKDQLKGSDISAAIGLGWDLPFGLMIDGRYNLGLSEINKVGTEGIKNQVIQVSVGYKLIKFGK